MKTFQKIALLSFAVLAVNTAFAQTTLQKNGFKRVDAKSKSATVKADATTATPDDAAPAAATQKQADNAAPAVQQTSAATKNNQAITRGQLSKQPLQKQDATRREAATEPKVVK